MNTLGRNGRLGNQMFQIASVMGLAHHFHTRCVFPKWAYSQYFEGPFPEGIIDGANFIKEEDFHYNIEQFHDLKAIDSIWRGVNIKGYLQSEKYFEQIKDHIRARFKFKKEFVIECLEGFTHVYEKPTIALHVRRGDYVGNENYINLPKDYYWKALANHFNSGEHHNIVVFSDDIKWCKEKFGFMPNMFFSEGKTDVQDLCRMSVCDHFIIANSSYSWWASWLGEKDGTKVIRPQTHFTGPKLGRSDIKDLYPTRWITGSI